MPVNGVCVLLLLVYKTAKLHTRSSPTLDNGVLLKTGEGRFSTGIASKGQGVGGHGQQVVVCDGVEVLLQIRNGLQLGPFNQAVHGLHTRNAPVNGELKTFPELGS